MKQGKDQKKMQGIGGTRLRLGMTQEIFAIALGISRSMLSRAENNLRSLPTPALIKLANLEIRLASTTNDKISTQTSVPEIRNNSGKEQVISKSLTKEKICNSRVLKFQCMLNDMVDGYEGLQKSISALDLLIKQSKDENQQDSFCTEHFEMERQRLLIKLTRISLPAQSALRHKIALLNATAELHALNAKLAEDTM